MRIRNIKNADSILNNSKYFIDNPTDYKGKYKELFNNDNPIYLEVGMGKGDFIIGMAEKYPNINFIGFEKYESVLVRAIKKLDTSNIENVRIICADASNIDEIFDHEIDKLYLNFSDPWPKKRHYKRRLTYRDFLSKYDLCFKDNANIEFKTDNDTLFESSLVELNNYGYTFDEVILDLHSKDIDNVETEYERKFSAKGFKIKRLIAHKSIGKKK